MPSPYESLSVITLEAWKMGVPVLANARCRVLMGQCLRSNGGLFYHGYAEFAEALDLLLERPDVRRGRSGRQGQAYVERRVRLGTGRAEGRGPPGPGPQILPVQLQVEMERDAFEAAAAGELDRDVAFQVLLLTIGAADRQA